MSDMFIHVRVTDPVKTNDTFGSHIVYRVETSTNSSDFSSQECSCSRRYSDFEWLHDQLSYLFPGSIIPPLPEKQTVGRFTPEFIEGRRRGIEKFMKRVTNHSVFKTSSCLVSFLEADDAGFTQCKAQYKQERAAASGSVTDWFGDKINTISTHTTLEPTEDDDLVQGALDYVLAWERQLTTVAKQSSQIVKSSRDKSKALFEFGQSFSSLGLNESNQELGDVLSNVGVAAAKLSSFQKDAALAESIEFEEPMHECVRILNEIKSSVKRRGDKRQNLINATADLHAKQSAYDKVLGVAGKEDIATSKLVLVETAQERVDLAQKELDSTTKQLLSEVAAFKIDKAAEFKSSCREFVKVLIELNDNTEKIWKDLQPTLQGVSRTAPQTSDSSNANNKQQQETSFSGVKDDVISFASPSAPQFEKQDQYDEEEAPPPPPPSNLMNEIDINEEDEADV